LIVREELVVEGAGDGPSYKGFRFPAEVISHAVWLYHRFPRCCHVNEGVVAWRRVGVWWGRVAAGSDTP
jgi:putative transposase